MKSISLYGARFRVIEIVSYFLLVVPWLGWFFGENMLGYNLPGFVLEMGLSAAILAFIYLLRDVRKKIQLLDLLKQNLSLAAIHDLKGPLTSIIGALQIIEDPGMEPLMRDKLLEVAARSSRDMVKLIQVLLDTERMEIAEMAVQKQALEVGPLIAKAIAALEPVSRDTGIELTVSVAHGIPRIYADRDLLLRVFENLALNAFKYSRRGGKIRMSASYADGNFHFEVLDTGLGIGPEDIKKVFEKYYRVEGQESESRKGSGFGLYFCRLAVEAHHGRIRIESRPGQGTDVVFDIPSSAK
jgi:signal transduction histidine kinase